MPPLARYDGLADWYDDPLTDFTTRATRLLVELLGGGPGRCLEIGCGGGILRPDIAAAEWSVVGLGISRDQLRVARGRSDQSTGLVQANGEQLPFPEATFDAVTAAFIHTDVDDWPAIVRDAARVLRRVDGLCTSGRTPAFWGRSRATRATIRPYCPRGIVGRSGSQTRQDLGTACVAGWGCAMCPLPSC